MPACLLAVSLLARGACLAQETPVFRTDISLVRVDLEVTDGTRMLTGFGKDDFRVFDNGATQKILHFSQDEEPLDVILLFDISGSMRPNVEKVAAASKVALAELKPGDRAAVMVFNSGSRLIAPFTDDLDAVERTVREDVMGLRFGGGTAILAAVDDAALYFLHERRSPRRRAVVIFTDDIGRRTRNVKKVIEHFWEADALLSGLIIRSKFASAMHIYGRVSAPYMNFLEAGMGGVAEKTGGDVIKTGEPGEAFREMIERIRRRYSLYYEMPNGKAGESRHVKVELNGDAKKRYPTGAVRARKGYLMPAKNS